MRFSTASLSSSVPKKASILLPRPRAASTQVLDSAPKHTTVSPCLVYLIVASKQQCVGLNITMFLKTSLFQLTRECIKRSLNDEQYTVRV